MFLVCVEDPLYIGVNSYMLQKAFMDLREVPLFLSLINSGDLEVSATFEACHKNYNSILTLVHLLSLILQYRTERTWLLHLLMDGLRDPMDYYICKKYHVFQQLFTVYSCSIADKYLQVGIYLHDGDDDYHAVIDYGNCW